MRQLLISEETIKEMLKRHLECCRASINERKPTKEIDDLGLAVLLACSEYCELVSAKNEIAQMINGNIEAVQKIGKPTGKEDGNVFWSEDFSLADSFSLTLARNILLNGKSEGEISAPFYLLCHNDSSLRKFCMNCVWLCKPYAPRANILSMLFENIAGTLGHVEYCIGLARAFYSTDEEFYLSAKGYKAEDRFFGQFEDRIDQTKEDPGRLGYYMNLFIPFENRIRKIVSDYAMSLSIERSSEAEQLPLNFSC